MYNNSRAFWLSNIIFLQNKNLLFLLSRHRQGCRTGKLICNKTNPFKKGCKMFSSFSCFYSLLLWMIDKLLFKLFKFSILFFYWITFHQQDKVSLLVAASAHKVHLSLPYWKGIWILEYGNFCLWNLEYGKILLMEFGILSFGIWNHTNDWNPESDLYWQILESSSWNRQHGIQNPRLSWISLLVAIK